MFKTARMVSKLIYADWFILAESFFTVWRSRLCAVGELTNCPPGTEAKFITKSRSLELLPGRIPSAEYEAWICTADDCFNVMPQLHKTFCYVQPKSAWSVHHFYLATISTVISILSIFDILSRSSFLTSVLLLSLI